MMADISHAMMPLTCFSLKTNQKKYEDPTHYKIYEQTET